ncbi:hypothetical protein B0H11DRAFT_1918239 [Mycena galericulata]|nr:hypothetical protein B0H11DRAFT_1918239 [Mycena galericulata]
MSTEGREILHALVQAAGRQAERKRMRLIKKRQSMGLHGQSQPHTQRPNTDSRRRNACGLVCEFVLRGWEAPESPAPASFCTRRSVPLRLSDQCFSELGGEDGVGCESGRKVENGHMGLANAGTPGVGDTFVRRAAGKVRAGERIGNESGRKRERVLSSFPISRDAPSWALGCLDPYPRASRQPLNSRAPQLIPPVHVSVRAPGATAGTERITHAHVRSTSCPQNSAPRCSPSLPLHLLVDDGEPGRASPALSSCSQSEKSALGTATHRTPTTTVAPRTLGTTAPRPRSRSRWRRAGRRARARRSQATPRQCGSRSGLRAQG